MTHELDWRKSTFSSSSGTCVEVAELPDGGRALRNSNAPDAGTATFTPAEWDAFVKGVKAGEFDG